MVLSGSLSLLGSLRLLSAHKVQHFMAAIMHFGDLSPKRGMSQIISITQNYIIAKWLNITLFGYNKGFLGRKTFIYSIFCREMLKYALWAEKNALRADSTLSFGLLDVPKGWVTVLGFIPK